MRHEYGLTIDDSGGATGHASIRPPAVSMIGNRLGFSLMELMVTIAIISILAAIATPNVITWHHNSRFNAAVREVKSAIEGTRMAAIRTNLPATVTFNNTTLFTTQTQTILAGRPGAGAVVNHRVTPGIRINSNFGGNQLTFNNRGMPNNGIAGTVTVRHTNGLTRWIVVTMVGSSSIQ